MRSVQEITLSALLLMGALLSRLSTRVSVALLWVVGLCFLGYFFAVHTLPDEFFWQSILSSNTSEAWEYLVSYRPKDAALLLSWAIPAGIAARYLWSQPRALPHKKIRWLAWFTLGLWALWFVVGASKGYDVYRIFSRVDRVYPLMMVNSWERYERYERYAELTSQPVTLTAPTQPPMVDVLLVVLGESASAHRWSLLGYSDHPTNTPLQPWTHGLITLPLTTNGSNTGMTLPVIVTGKPQDPWPASGMTSYIDHAKHAGFHTPVLSNQQAPGFSNIALRMRSDSYIRLQDGSFDGALTDLLDQTLQSNATHPTPLVVTLHTYGSHPRVEKRTPDDKKRWGDPYDNSIFYSSELLADWISRLDAMKNQRVALVYVSDHGQDFPSCGGSYIHGITRTTYEVPFLLWGNARLRTQYPQWWEQWQHIASHAVNHDGIPRFTTLLPALAIEQLLGYARRLPSTEGLSSSGTYPPPQSPALCADWTSQVKKLHPAASHTR